MGSQRKNVKVLCSSVNVLRSFFNCPCSETVYQESTFKCAGTTMVWQFQKNFQMKMNFGQR